MDTTNLMMDLNITDTLTPLNSQYYVTIESCKSYIKGTEIMQYLYMVLLAITLIYIAYLKFYKKNL